MKAIRVMLGWMTSLILLPVFILIDVVQEFWVFITYPMSVRKADQGHKEPQPTELGEETKYD